MHIRLQKSVTLFIPYAGVESKIAKVDHAMDNLLRSNKRLFRWIMRLQCDAGAQVSQQSCQLNGAEEYNRTQHRLGCDGRPDHQVASECDQCVLMSTLHKAHGVSL